MIRRSLKCAKLAVPAAHHEFVIMIIKRICSGGDVCLEKYTQRKSIYQALEAIISMRDDKAKREEQRLWCKIHSPIHMGEALGRLTKDELTVIRQRLNIKKASSLKKDELNALLSEKIPDMFESICIKLDSSLYDIIEKAADHEGVLPASNLDSNQLKHLGRYGVIFTGEYEGDKVAVLPAELVTRFYEIDHKRVKNKVQRNTEWIFLTQGLLYYYGTLSTSQLIDKVTQHSNYNIDTLDFLHVIYDTMPCYELLQFDKNGFFHKDVNDTDSVVKGHQMRKDVPFYPFKKEQLLKAGNPGYVDRNKSYWQFLKFLTENYDIHKDEADIFVESYQHAIRNNHSPNDILNDVQQTFQFESEDEIRAFMDHFIILFNNTREWVLKGHTSVELRELEEKHLNPLPEQKDNVISFSSRKKVGRNDPCPCGSGKKFKKCCGK